MHIGAKAIEDVLMIMVLKKKYSKRTQIPRGIFLQIPLYLRID